MLMQFQKAVITLVAILIFMLLLGALDKIHGHQREIPIVVLGLSLQDALGMAFGGGVLLWSIWYAYRWEIKPNREALKRRADEHREEMHRKHWEQLRSAEPKHPNDSRHTSHN